MKKLLSLLLCALLLASALAGCAKPKNAGEGRAENEIFTYSKIDPAKTLITVSVTGNLDIAGLCAGFEAKNPDVQVVTLDLTGGDHVTPYREWVLNGCGPDVMITMTRGFSAEETFEYFEELSNKPYISNYESEALNRTAIDSRLYWLPGLSQIDCMAYNKTLFEQYGWQVPTSFDDFVSLCAQIREDTGGAVQPWNPNAKYMAEFEKASEAFVYDECFAGADNRAWYEDFINQKATFAGHMEPYYNAVKTLVDNGFLLEEHFDYSATTRNNEFLAGKIAMINKAVTKFESDEFEFDYIPFPTTQGDVGYVCSNVCSFVGMPKKERSAAQKDAAERFLAFVSSSEGQQFWIGDTLMLSNVKGAAFNFDGPLSGLQPAIDSGHNFEYIMFLSPNGARNFSLTSGARAMLSEGKTAEECIAAVDAMPYKPGDASVAADPPETLAVATESFTILETSQYIADMYREKAGADIGLINNNIAYRGNLMRIFAKELTTNDTTVLKPRSFASDSTLVKVSMTGTQISDALNHPVGADGVSDSVYAFSGLKCEVAPWNPLGEKYLSITLEDGSALEPDKLYSVAVWQGTVADEYITETLESYEGAWAELMSEKLRADGEIAPAKDGRITLVWD